MLKPLTASFVYMNTEERMLRMMKSFDEVGLDSNMVEINHLYLHDNEIGIYGGEIMSPLVKHRMTKSIAHVMNIVYEIWCNLSMRGASDASV